MFTCLSGVQLNRKYSLTLEHMSWMEDMRGSKFLGWKVGEHLSWWIKEEISRCSYFLHFTSLEVTFRVLSISSQLGR